MKHRKLIALLPLTTLWLSAVTGCENRTGANEEASAARVESKAESKSDDARPTAGSTRKADEATPTVADPAQTPMDMPVAEAQAAAKDSTASPMRTMSADKKGKASIAMPGAA